MTATGPAIPCPSCRRVLEKHTWHDAHSGRCSNCTTEFEFFPFPALTAVKARIAPQAVAVAEESVCFFHAENRAESVCEDCGRLLCAVCAINFSGRKVCPSCISATKKTDAAPVAKDRMLYDSLALTLALAPVLIFFLFFLTVVTAPIALGLVIYGWKKPGSIVRGRGRLIAAAIISGLEVGGWLVVLALYLLKKP